MTPHDRLVIIQKTVAFMEVYLDAENAKPDVLAERDRLIEKLNEIAKELQTEWMNE